MPINPLLPSNADLEDPGICVTDEEFNVLWAAPLPDQVRDCSNSKRLWGQTFRVVGSIEQPIVRQMEPLATGVS